VVTLAASTIPAPLRGRPITVAATCADILARTLERCGVKVEILGFTTAPGRAGNRARPGSRPQARQSGTPQRRTPHHLQIGRHAVAARAPQSRPDDARGLLKENIDGEALDWAHKRLLGRSEQRKILI